MKLTQLFVLQREEAGEEELAEIRQFRTNTLQLYLSILDGRSSWATLISALKILVQSTEDKLFTVCNNGLSLIYDAFNILHLMHHEATACHVTQVKYIYSDSDKLLTLHHLIYYRSCEKFWAFSLIWSELFDHSRDHRSCGQYCAGVYLC